jgi:uncharacterized protein YodC (DUF2158 family)
MSLHVYFHTGDLVQLKQDLPHKPTMVVQKISKIRPTKEDTAIKKPILLGITCFWFTKDGLYQERTFSSKDLEKLC